jgi:2-polyprenyl-3-methyl-5-hydroxy-6-metoxy-1,4-benzoquinol methylase
VRALLRTAALGAISRLAGRHATFLPPAAGDPALTLSAVAPYRVQGPELEFMVRVPSAGELVVRLFEQTLTGAGRPLASFAAVRVDQPRELRLTLNLDARQLRCHGALVPGEVPQLPHAFASALAFRAASGVGAERWFSHYRADRVEGENYFCGGHYRDYEIQGAADVPHLLEWLERWRCASPVLDVGCATGLLLQALHAKGYEVGGVDASAWAVERARQRLQTDNVWLADVDRDGLPLSASHRGWNTIVVAAALEHFSNPAAVIAELAACAAPGARLFITTCNGNSLTRVLYGQDWEGHADPTHKAADRITPPVLRGWLECAGWTVLELRTHSIWDSNLDTTHSALRQAVAADARLRLLLTELERGDFVDVVAERRSSDVR